MAEGDVLGRNAGVADLVDASGSEPDGSNPGEVQLFSPARDKIEWNQTNNLSS